jgi:hypothetical protein
MSAVPGRLAHPLLKSSLIGRNADDRGWLGCMCRRKICPDFKLPTSMAESRMRFGQPLS